MRIVEDPGVVTAKGSDRVSGRERAVPDVALWCRSGDGDQPPLIAVHTWPEEDSHYSALSDALGGRPIFSILPPHVDSPDMPRRVDDWVDRALSVLDELPVEPPYRLIGWSFGGVVAMETARRLISRGSEVSFVGAFDTTRPKLRPLSTREYFWYHLGESLDIPDERRRIRYLAGRSRALLHRNHPVAARAIDWTLQPFRPRRNGKRAPRVWTPQPTDPLRISIHVSYLNYRGSDITFPVSLYVTAPSVSKSKSSTLRWGRWFTAGYELVEVPGDHSSLFDPGNVEQLARAVQCSLSITDLRPCPGHSSRRS